MDFIPLSDNASRQVIDAITVDTEHRRTRANARTYAGGMYWKRQGDYEYLVKTQPDNRQARIGPRSAQTEATLAEFSARKAALDERLKSLRAALTEAERLNKAVMAGRTPAQVVALLQTLEDAGPGQNETAINAKGFEVDFLRRQPDGDDPHPFRFSDDEDDLWPVQALRASVLTKRRALCTQ